MKEPMSANDYDDRTTAAVKSVLLEIGQILGSFQGKFAVVGGAVPWLLLNESEMPHIGTIDVDLALDPVAMTVGESNTEINAITPFWVGQYSTPIVGQFSMPIYIRRRRSCRAVDEERQMLYRFCIRKRHNIAKP